MAFLEERISDAVARGSRGGPVTLRDMARTTNGDLSQVFLRSVILHRYDISFGIKTADDFEAVRALFFVVMGGGYSGFRMRDWGDYRARRTNTAVALLSGSDYQLQRAYTAGAVSYLRDIRKPADDVVLYTAGGAPCTATVDNTTGIATVTSGTPASWAGTFDVPVTFSDDAMDAIAVDGWVGHELHGLPSLLLEELLNP